MNSRLRPVRLSRRHNPDIVPSCLLTNAVAKWARIQQNRGFAVVQYLLVTHCQTVDDTAALAAIMITGYALARTMSTTCPSCLDPTTAN